MKYLLIAGGALLVAGAVIWRAASRIRTRRTVRRSLTHGSPHVRKVAIEALGIQGVRPYAHDLLELVAWETDADVLDAVAAAVNRSQWESAITPDLFNLRMWAARHAPVAPVAADDLAVTLDLRERPEPPAKALNLFHRDEWRDPVPEAAEDSYPNRAIIVSVDELRERRQKWA